MKLKTLIFPSEAYFALFKKYIQLDSTHYDDENMSITIEAISFEMEIATKVFNAIVVDNYMVSAC